MIQRNYITGFVIILFFCFGLWGLARELYHTYAQTLQLQDASVHEKRGHLLGEPYAFAALCNQIIPEGAGVLFLTNAASNINSADLHINYDIYPRKLYLLNTEAPYPESLPAISSIDTQALLKQNISWIVMRYPVPYGINRVVALKNGEVAEMYNLDLASKNYNVHN